ncbi:MAG: glycerophosphodiester phosphodiesterase family protein [Pseudobdellovibrionaceae bacterium]
MMRTLRTLQATCSHNARALLVLFFSSYCFADINILAHKGLHIPFRTPPEGADCVAELIDDPLKYPEKTRYFLENTLPAIREAFAIGATMVSINLWATADNRVVLFHDEKLDCRTDGAGSIESKTFAALRSLNVGWDYTPDGKKTFPWRDKTGSELVTMPSLEEVMAENPGRSFWIVIRTSNDEMARVILSKLSGYPEMVRRSALFASNRVNELVRGEFKETLKELEIPRLSTQKSDECLKAFRVGHTLPEVCANLDVIVSRDSALKLGDDVREFSRELGKMSPPSSLSVGGELGELVDDTKSAKVIKSNRQFFRAFMTGRIDLVGPAFAGP